MKKHEVVWSASQLKIIVHALDFCLKRLSLYSKAGDRAIKARHDDYERLSEQLSSQKPDKDGLVRLKLDMDCLALIKAAVVSCRAQSPSA